MAFEIKDTQEFVLDGQTYKFKPLTGRYIGKIYSLMKSFSKVKEGSEETVLEAMDEETVGKLYDVVYETVIKSYPTEDKAKLEMWVSQNLMKLIEPVLKINLPTESK
jgi:hypothetical protein